MELVKEPVDRRRKRNIQAVFIAFMGLLAFFTLFSNTLQSMTLPKVKTEKPAKRAIEFTLKGSGTLQPFAEANLSNSAGWKVQTILVKEGDRVKKGQKLIAYDSNSAQRELEDERANLEKQKIALQNIQDQLVRSAREGDEFEIRNVRRNIETLQLDIGTQERKISGLRERLTSQQEMTAPFDGVITQLNAVEGLASAGEPEIMISNSSLGYRLDISADLTLVNGLGISPGEKIGVEVYTIPGQQTRMIDGTVDAVDNGEPGAGNTPGEEAGQAATIPRKIIRVKLVDSELKGGEQARIILAKHSRQEGLVVSNEAIHRDRDGMFVYKIDGQRGALGNVFVARKVQIHSSETNDKETMIQSDSLYEDDMIILESSEPLQDGNRVRLQ